MEEETNIVPKNVGMYPEQWDVVEQVNQRLGLRSTSMALRVIINDYVRLMDRTAEQTPVPVQSNN